MTRERLYLFDTTLRDGQQTQGVQFSTDEKITIARALDSLGVDHIEGGWPGANPTDSAFFDAAPETRATMTAFGMTKRNGMSAENDDVLAAVLNANPPAVCLVGKTHDFHVETALGITLDENTDNIAKSVDHLGIHTHNDTENAVACALAAVDAGARQIQGTLNGLGERCGNANLTTLIPILLLKEPYASRLQTGVPPEALENLTRISRMLDEILNRVPQKQAAFVGASAFAHKAGLHASAIAKDPTTYEHIDPARVGNTRIIPMSNQAGQSNLRERLTGMGLTVDRADPALGRILDRIKTREAEGYSYDTAQASFELLAREELGQLPDFFEVKRYRVTVERRKNKYDKMISLSEAVVVVKVDGEKLLSVSESMDETGSDRGPVNALSKALSKDLGRYSAHLEDLRLVDFKVRITQGGTEAVTRVIIDSEDGQGRRWSTVGVSANIVDASFEALLDAIKWKLIRDVV